MARTTVANTIERIRRQLASGQREEVNQLLGDHGPTTPEIRFAFELPSGLRAGAIVCCGIETMRVMDVDLRDKKVTVIRGWQDSEGQDHKSGDEVWINPRFQPMDIYEGIRTEIASWGVELYDVIGGQSVITPGQNTVALPAELTGCYGIVELRSQAEAASSVSAWPRLPFRIQRGAGSTWSAAASGTLLRFTESVAPGPAYVLAAMPFDVSALTPDGDLVDDIHLAPSMLDVVDKGVQLQVLMEAENSRGARTAQDEPRNAAETPWGAGLQSIQLVNAIYRRRKTEEAMKLAARYPFTGV